MNSYIDMRAEYVLIQYVRANRPSYIFVQYTDNEDFCEELGEYVLLLNEELARGGNITFYRSPLKAATVSDFSHDIPTLIISTKMENPASLDLLKTWVKESRKQ
jgi:hypothetical protein